MSRCIATFFIGLVPLTVAAQSPQVETKGSARVRVLLPDGQPAHNAHVHASVWTYEKGFQSNQSYKTDKNGWATVRLPKKLYILRLWARKTRYVPLFLNWNVNDLKEVEKDNRVPDTFEFKLPQGTRVSGIVKNEDGEPIEGAEVAVRHDISDGPVGEIQLGTWLAYGDPSEGPGHALRTDKNGRWELNDVPEGDNVRITVKLRHPDYVNDLRWGTLQKEQGVRMSQLRDGTAVIVMKRGIRLRGLVVDGETSKPIKDAVVIFGNDPYFQQDSQEVRTNEKGWYEFPPQQPTKNLLVTVVAKGYAPTMKQPELSKELEKRKLRFDASFRLKRGKTIRIRFVDQDKKPVPKVYVSICRWRGVQSLYNHRHPNVLNTGIPYRANEDGVWEWTWAPDEAVWYSFGLLGYDVISAPEAPFDPSDGIPLTAGEETYEVQLRKKVPN